MATSVPGSASDRRGFRDPHGVEIRRRGLEPPGTHTSDRAVTRTSDFSSGTSTVSTSAALARHSSSMAVSSAARSASRSARACCRSPTRFCAVSTRWAASPLRLRPVITRSTSRAIDRARRLPPSTAPSSAPSARGEVAGAPRALRGPGLLDPVGRGVEGDPGLGDPRLVLLLQLDLGVVGGVVGGSLAPGGEVALALPGARRQLQRLVAPDLGGAGAVEVVDQRLLGRGEVRLAGQRGGGRGVGGAGGASVRRSRSSWSTAMAAAGSTASPSGRTTASYSSVSRRSSASSSKSSETRATSAGARGEPGRADPHRRGPRRRRVEPADRHTLGHGRATGPPASPAVVAAALGSPRRARPGGVTAAGPSVAAPARPAGRPSAWRSARG